MLFRVREVHVSVLRLVCMADKNEDFVIVNQSVQDLLAILEPLISEAVHVIACGCDADHQLVGICLHGFLETVILCRFLEGVDLVRYCYITVEGILRVRVRRHGIDLDRPLRSSVVVREGDLDRVLHVVVLDLADLLFIDSVINEGILQIIEGFHRLLQCRRRDVYLASGFPLQYAETEGKRSDP